MDNLSPNTVFNGHGSTYLSDNNLNKSKVLGFPQGSKNEPGALQLLFRRQDG